MSPLIVPGMYISYTTYKDKKTRKYNNKREEDKAAAV